MTPKLIKVIVCERNFRFGLLTHVPRMRFLRSSGARAHSCDLMRVCFDCLVAMLKKELARCSQHFTLYDFVHEIVHCIRSEIREYDLYGNEEIEKKTSAK